jgi:hypothetical protein
LEVWVDVLFDEKKDVGKDKMSHIFNHIIRSATSADVSFITGELKNAPEVYDPGGLTFMMDDFYALKFFIVRFEATSYHNFSQY